MIANQKEWPVLIQSALDGIPDDFDGTRAASLNDLLRTHAAARELYLQMADVHSCLAVDEKLWVDGPNIDTFPLQSGFQTPNPKSNPSANSFSKRQPAPAPALTSAPATGSAESFRPPLPPSTNSSPGASRRDRWLAWRPLAAAAAGLVFGMGCTTVVFAYSQPKTGSPDAVGAAPAPASRVQPLTDSDFENPDAIPARGIPSASASWGGDFSRTVTAENGIIPRHGVRMLRFLRSDHEHSSTGERSFVGEAAQVIDLRPLRGDPGKTEYLLELSAHFNAIAQAPGGRYEFAVKAAAFRGAPGDAPRLWENPEASLSRSNRCVIADSDASSWQRLALPMMVTSEADFLVIECAVVWKGPPSAQGVAEFPGHYVDQVEVRLADPPGTAP